MQWRSPQAVSGGVPTQTLDSQNVTVKRFFVDRMSTATRYLGQCRRGLPECPSGNILSRESHL
jgi:hypothetical protein